MIRYELKQAGELVHIDIKRFARIEREGHRIHGNLSRKARGAGYEHAHVCVDDASRVAYVELLPTLKAADAWFQWLSTPLLIRKRY